jgi:hypothetical protein
MPCEEISSRGAAVLLFEVKSTGEWKSERAMIMPLPGGLGQRSINLQTISAGIAALEIGGVVTRHFFVRGTISIVIGCYTCPCRVSKLRL